MAAAAAPPAGLCAQCRFVRRVHAARSQFVLCRRAERDPAFPRYPRVPVLTCPGYEPVESDDTPAS